MKFLISSIHFGEDKIEEAYPFLKGKVEIVEDEACKQAYIEINTIEELMNISKEVCEDIILNYGEKPEITIYDDYIEDENTIIDPMWFD